MDNKHSIREKNLAILKKQYGKIYLLGNINSLKYFINYIGANVNKYISAILVPKGTVQSISFNGIPIKEIDYPPHTHMCFSPIIKMVP
ncbi:MAG: hypothetical protein J6O04_12435 [Selenomonadaceae bacterium]|nr:hypothetical protein [Selenomonadaceae bacterium]